MGQAEHPAYLSLVAHGCEHRERHRDSRIHSESKQGADFYILIIPHLLQLGHRSISRQAPKLIVPMLRWSQKFLAE